MTNGWTGGQYSIFRVIFGTYLCVHFAQLLCHGKPPAGPLPWGVEIFSSAGVFPDAPISPLIHGFPNILGVWDSPTFVIGLLVAGAALSVVLALGLFDRIAAVALWYIWACLHGRNPLISNPGLPYIGWMLLAHACLPPAPFLSLRAVGRPDPRGGWFMPPLIFAAAWILMALGYSFSGYTKLISPSWLDGTALSRVLDNPLARPGIIRDLVRSLPEEVLKVATWGALGMELLFAPLALFRLTRPWIWGLMLLMHVNLMLVVDFIDLSMGMVMLHLFTFDPGWLSPLSPWGRTAGYGAGSEGKGAGAPPTELIYYDGHCGLCHRWIRFVLAEDHTGATFRFAPLGLDTFLANVPEDRRAGLPDSVVVQKASGELLVRSAAALYILARLGGIWRLIATLARIIPSPILNFLYDGGARIRYRLFRQPADVCPLIPRELRTRFDV